MPATDQTEEQRTHSLDTTSAKTPAAPAAETPAPAAETSAPPAATSIDQLTHAAITERILRTASQTLEHMRFGLTIQGCKAVCELLLPETAAMAVAMTDRTSVLGYAGEMASIFPVGSPIRTQPTRDVLKTGAPETFGSVHYTQEGYVDIDGPAVVADVANTSSQTSSVSRAARATYTAEQDGYPSEIPAGIVVPLFERSGSDAVGTIKFYYNHPEDINPTQIAIVSGFGELLSTQLASHALERQEALTAQAELRALQAQINPHFLFNTLNTIAALTRTNPSEARELLREFAAFYRQTLEGAQSLIPLGKELEQTRRYLRFEHARFGENRIIEQEQVNEGCEQVLVPAFIVQPIVENAVRHAMRDEGPLYIDIHALFEGPDLLISITDDGLGMSGSVSSRILSRNENNQGAGIALRNVRERLERLYAEGSGLDIVSREGEGTCVTLRLMGARDNRGTSTTTGATASPND